MQGEAIPILKREFKLRIMEELNKNKGIMIMALGHPYYGRMAHNLAVSIKAIDSSMPIALVFAGDAMNHLSLFNLSATFDFIIEAPAESYTRNGKIEWIKAKTWMYDFSPFDETIYLDADMIWLPFHKPEELFTQFKEINFTIINRSSYVMWAELEDIRKAYDLAHQEYHHVSTEFVFFRKCDHMKALFASVKEIYNDVKVKHKSFAGAIPDELPFAIAMMQHDVHPHQKSFVPVYWQSADKKIPANLNQAYYAISAGGKTVGDWTKNNYDRLVQYYFHNAGLRNIWKLKHKRSFLPERINT